MLALLLVLAAPPTNYTVDFPAPHTHYAEITARVATGGAEYVEVLLPVWTPGSYLVREYSRHLEGVPGTKVAKNRWRIATQGQDPLTFKYRVYGREMSVRTNFFDHDFAFISPAATFLVRPELMKQPIGVEVRGPERWKVAETGLAQTAARTFRAEDYDELVDSPLVAGDLQVDRFSLRGKEHRLATLAPKGRWDNARAAKDLRTLAAEHIRFWGDAPYPHYVFLNLLAERGGGLEHLDSTVLMGTSWAQNKRKSYVGWLRLASHEFFHTWNVKRLRPVQLGPFDYEAENHTRALWVAEGITSYYDGLLLRRAGLSTDTDFYDRLTRSIKDVQTSPGRHVRSLEDSSFDAWIKFYRPDENSRNTSVSYYTKGAAVAWLLDVELRRHGKATLDDVMRAAYKKYGGDKGFSEAEFEALVSEIAGRDFNKFFEKYTRGTAELDYAPALAWLGLRFMPARKDADDPAAGYLGINLRDGRVSEVPHDGPAYGAGINVGDELIAIDDVRIDDLAKTLARFRVGTKVEVLVARRGTLRRIPVTLAEKPGDTWKVQADPDAKKAAVARRKAWLGGVKRP